MQENDEARQMREWLHSLSPDEIQDSISHLGSGSLERALNERMPELPEPPTDPRALTVRVDVDDVRPPVWRRLVLHGDLTLDELHEVLQAAFDWEDYHLHKFWPGPQKQIWGGPSFLTEQDVLEGEEGVLESGVRLDQLLREPGDRLFYTYDFGDNWTHTIKLESSAALDPERPRAACTEGRMAGPLEDSGGSYGHQEMVDAYLADPSLCDLDTDRREWLPAGWDPTAFSVEDINDRLSLVRLPAREVPGSPPNIERPGASGPPPTALEPLLALAPPPVAAQMLALCREAYAAPSLEQATDRELAVIARPYRLLIELAGEEGIPLTSAGWMRPAYVERLYDELDLGRDWIGKGNREDMTLPVRQLRETGQKAGLLRKNKNRLLPTRLARSLTTDGDHVAAVAARLLEDRDNFVRGGLALFALMTAASGDPAWGHNTEIARLMTACGLRTGPTGVDPGHVAQWTSPLRDALERAESGDAEEAVEVQARRAAILARASLWP